MAADMTAAEQDALLDRASPAYRAAVLGARRVRGAVQFNAYALSQRDEGGHTILRATIDEGQAVEIRLPAGMGVYFTKRRGGRG